MNTADIIGQAMAQGRDLLTEIESKNLLHAAGVPVELAVLCDSAEKAVEAAQSAGYPVVLKIVSPDITHKSDVGGVKVGLNDADEVAGAYADIVASARKAVPDADISGVAVQHMAPSGTEIIVGMTTDDQFGPVLMFGLGGVMVEVMKDVAFRIVPLEERDALQMIDEIKGRAVLDGVRGQSAADTGAIADVLLKVSAFVESEPRVREIDLNPIMVYPEGAVAVDARVVIGD
jgi:acyl-CoA synthetase (NDP forming)